MRLTLLVLAACAAPAFGQADSLWLPAGSENWGTAANWSNGLPQTSLARTAVFTSATTSAATVSMGASSRTAYGLRVEDPAGAVTANPSSAGGFVLRLGDLAGGTAGGVLVGTAATTAASDLILGGTGVGSSNLSGVQLNADQTWDVRAGRSLTVSTTSSTAGIDLNGKSLTLNTVNAAGDRSDITLNGLMQSSAGGAGALTLTGTGLVTIGASGTLANTFAGPVSVQGAVLTLNKAASLASTSVTVSSGQVRFTNTPVNALATTTNLTVSGTGEYNTTSLNTDASTTTNNNGHTQTYASVTHSSSGLFAAGINSALSVTGTWAGSGSGQLTVNRGATLAAAAFDFSAGSGAVTLRGDNTTGGASLLTVGAGGLTLGGRSIGLNTVATLATHIGSRVELNGPVTATGTSALTLTNVVTTAGGNDVRLNDAARVVSVSGALDVFTVSPALVDGTGASGLAKQGAGVLVLGGTNARPSTYTGTTRVDAGTLRLGLADLLPDAAPLRLNGGTFSSGASAGFADTTGTLSATAAGSKIALGTGSHTLTFAGFDAAAFAGLTVDGWAGTPSAGGSAGRLVFTDTSGFTGAVLGAIQFTGYDPGAVVVGNELVPVPEPAGLLVVLVLPILSRRMRNHRVRSVVE